MHPADGTYFQPENQLNYGYSHEVSPKAEKMPYEFMSEGRRKTYNELYPNYAAENTAECGRMEYGIPRHNMQQAGFMCLAEYPKYKNYGDDLLDRPAYTQNGTLPSASPAIQQFKYQANEVNTSMPLIGFQTPGSHYPYARNEASLSKPKQLTSDHLKDKVPYYRYAKE